MFKLDNHAELVLRVIMSPEHTKDFQKVLNRLSWGRRLMLNNSVTFSNFS